ncbi:MAG: LLM class F420-dependent oxidoreductase [Dehalococcoidia bacterium]
MKLGLFPPLSAPVATPEYIETVATAAERLGFNSVWAPEHVVLFSEHSESRYPYSVDGQIGVPPSAGILDPFEVLTFIAGVTRTLRVGTGIALVPQRNPVYTAKAAASLDWLSGGRFDFGIGIGWLKEEFESLQVPWPKRAQRTAEYVEVMKRLWIDQESSFDGEFYKLKPVWQYPKPVQQPHPPLYFGGESDGALRRAASIGNGWFGYNHDPESAKERLGVLDRLLTENGRSRKDIRVIIATARHRATPEMLEEFAELGIDEIILSAGARRAEDMVGRMEALAEELLAKANSL